MDLIIRRRKLVTAEIVKVLHKSVENVSRHGECGSNVWFGFEVKFVINYGGIFSCDNNVLLFVL